MAIGAYPYRHVLITLVCILHIFVQVLYSLYEHIVIMESVSPYNAMRVVINFAKSHRNIRTNVKTATQEIAAGLTLSDLYASDCISNKLPAN